MKAKTKSELALEYGVCIKTFNKWLKRHNIRNTGELYTPKEQKSIYKALGFPKNS
ncbi:MAG: DUF4248 domain-containing protein [Bacteroidales bacterium]|nr:DUF4248 domain-containing protein [Bacteroidales bacterium]